MLELIIYFLSLLNPFALFIYTLPLKKELGLRGYINVLTRASVISYFIYLFFALFGSYFFDTVLKISFDSFRIFGGIVLVAFALSFIIQGKESLVTTKGKLNRIASEVALPFMVGAGTITLSIVLGKQLTAANSALALAVIMIINLLAVSLLAIFRHSLKARLRSVLDENLEILLRINGFIVGAFGIDLIVTGLQNFF